MLGKGCRLCYMLFLSLPLSSLQWKEIWFVRPWTIPINFYFVIYLTDYQLALLLFLVHLFKLWRCSTREGEPQMLSDLRSWIPCRYCAGSDPVPSASPVCRGMRGRSGLATATRCWPQDQRTDCRVSGPK